MDALEPRPQAPYNTTSGRDCLKSLRLRLHGTCPQKATRGNLPKVDPGDLEESHASSHVGPLLLLLLYSRYRSLKVLEP